MYIDRFTDELPTNPQIFLTALQIINYPELHCWKEGESTIKQKLDDLESKIFQKVLVNDLWWMNNFQTMSVCPLESQHRKLLSSWRFSNERIDTYLWPDKLLYK